MLRTTSTKTMIAILVGVGGFAYMGCSSDSSTPAASTSTAVAVTGTLSAASTAQGMNSLMSAFSDGDSDNEGLAVSDYSVVCATTSAPILSGTGVVGTDGRFSVTIDGAVGKPMACYMVNAAGVKAADFLVEDTSSKDLNGKAEKVTTMTPSSGVSMDTVVFDAAKGEVTVSKSVIASSLSTTRATSVFDPTGAWTLGPVDFTLPSGVKAPCTAAEQAAHTCNGPPEGQSVYMKMWTGTKTADSSPIYGLQLWNSESKYTGCGSRVGLSASQKTDIGVSFAAQATADQEFAFPTSVTFTDQILSASSSPTLTDNWKMSTAKTRYAFNPNCGPVNVTIGSLSYTNAWRCGPDASSDYQIGLGGGCTINSTGANVQVSNWTGITCGSASTDADGVKSVSCTGNTPINSVSTAVTCTHKWVVVNSSNVVQPSGSFNYGEMSGGIAADTLCSAIPTSSNAGQMAQLRCYADYYYQSGLANNGSSCMPRVNTDWSASTPADFIHKDFRPEGLVFSSSINRSLTVLVAR
ncbi:MAG: hypothetical protein IPK04_21880 [Bdellovibrionales bacterium]|nr:hypothetical protein [Bdellovibrionales bacterium]